MAIALCVLTASCCASAAVSLQELDIGIIGLLGPTRAPFLTVMSGSSNMCAHDSAASPGQQLIIMSFACIIDVQITLGACPQMQGMQGMHVRTHVGRCCVHIHTLYNRGVH